jgi:F0F1-type ATP synthase membrane subunit b/b'
MEKKISTKEEQAIDWLKGEIEKDKLQLENEKKRLIESLKGFNKEDIVKPVKKLTLWQRIKKVLMT